MDYLKLIVLGLVAVFAAVAANYARDLPYMVNAIEVAIAATIAFIYVLRNVDVPRYAPETEYFDSVIRAGVIATCLWGVVGFLVGVTIAFQLAFPQLNPEWLREF